MPGNYRPPKTAVTPQQLYRLIHAIYVMLDDGDRRVLREFNLTLSQYRVLRRLDREKGQRLTTLSRRLLFAKSTITRIIDQLESEGLVQRTLDAEDRRAWRVVLTPAGEELLTRAREAHERAVQERLNGAFDSEEGREQFSALLRTLHDYLVEDLRARKSNHRTG